MSDPLASILEEIRARRAARTPAPVLFPKAHPRARKVCRLALRPCDNPRCRRMYAMPLRPCCRGCYPRSKRERFCCAACATTGLRLRWAWADRQRAAQRISA